MAWPKKQKVNACVAKCIIVKLIVKKGCIQICSFLPKDYCLNGNTCRFNIFKELHIMKKQCFTNESLFSYEILLDLRSVWKAIILIPHGRWTTAYSWRRKKGEKGLRVEVEMRGLGKNWKKKEMRSTFGGRGCGWTVRNPTMIMGAPTRGRL